MSEAFDRGPYQPPIGLREALAGVRRVFITAHVDPDGDALGSAMGMYNLLRREGFDATPVCIGRLPSFAPSLPGIDAIRHFPDRIAAGTHVDPILEPGDAVLVMDTPAADRMAAFYDVHRALLPQCQVIVFDHHFTNERFGNVNYIDPAAAATAEVVVDILDASGINLDPSSSTCLMTALVADTQAFRTENTSPRSLLLGYRLSAAGAPIYATVESMLKTRPLSALRLWGAALDHMQAENGVVWTKVTGDMLAADATMEDSEGLVDLLLSSKDSRVAIVLKELHPGETKVSMRTLPGIDATRIVGAFGGGGHQRAAGCTIMAPADEAARRLLPLVAEELQRGVSEAEAVAAGSH